MGRSTYHGIFDGINQVLPLINSIVDEQNLEKRKKKQLEEKLKQEEVDAKVNSLRETHDLITRMKKFKSYKSGQDPFFSKLGSKQKESILSVEEDILATKLLKRLGLTNSKDARSNIVSLINKGSVDHVLGVAGVDPNEYNQDIEEFSPYLNLEKKSNKGVKKLDHFLSTHQGDAYPQVRQSFDQEEDVDHPLPEKYSPEQAEAQPQQSVAYPEQEGPSLDELSSGNTESSVGNIVDEDVSPNDSFLTKLFKRVGNVNEHKRNMSRHKPKWKEEIAAGAMHSPLNLADGALGLAEKGASYFEPTDRAFQFLRGDKARTGLKSAKQGLKDTLTKVGGDPNSKKFQAGEIAGDLLALGGTSSGIRAGAAAVIGGKAAVKAAGKAAAKTGLSKAVTAAGGIAGTAAMRAGESAAFGSLKRSAADEKTTFKDLINDAIWGAALGGVERGSKELFKSIGARKLAKAGFNKVANEGHLGRQGMHAEVPFSASKMERMFNYRDKTMRQKPFGSPAELDYRMKAMGPEATTGEILGTESLINRMKKDVGDFNISRLEDIQTSAEHTIQRSLVKHPDRIKIYQNLEKNLENSKKAASKDYGEVITEFSTAGESRFPKLKLSNDQIEAWNKILDTHWDDFKAIPRMKPGWSKGDQKKFTHLFRNALNGEKQLKSLGYEGKSFSEIQKSLDLEMKSLDPKFIKFYKNLNSENVNKKELLLSKKQKVFETAKKYKEQYESFLKEKGAPDPNDLLKVRTHLKQLQSSNSSDKYSASLYHTGLQNIIKKAGKNDALFHADKNYAINIGPFNQKSVQEALKSASRTEGREGAVSVKEVFGKSSTQNALLYQKLSVADKKNVIYSLIQESVEQETGHALKHTPSIYKMLPKYIINDSSAEVQSIVKELKNSANLAKAIASLKRTTSSDIGSRNVVENAALSGTDSGTRIIKQASRRGLKNFRDHRFRQDTSRDYIDFYNSGSPGREVPELAALREKISKHSKARVPPSYWDESTDNDDKQDSFSDYQLMKRGYR